jgi:tetratricopeptide (TPR) repeat protein
LSALELQRALAPFKAESARQGVEFEIRVGLNSGEVIVGEIGDQGQMDYTAIGHTMGMAQRMESLAAPGSTALSAATAGLVRGEFELREMGEFDVKGSSVPMLVFELVGEAAAADRLEAAGARGGLSRFVGRERERAMLEEALERATSGEGQVVGLVGEPGVGKSRLAHEFAAHCAARGIPVERARAVAHRRDVPLLPLLELMRTTLGVSDRDQPAVARERIAHALKALDPSFEADLPLLFDFLGVADPGHPPLKLEPDARQRQLLNLVHRFVHARSAVQTAVTVLEDVHWLDDASSRFLAELVRAAAGARLLLVLTYRPEYRGEELRGSHCEQLALRPLARPAIDELLRSLLGDDASLDGLSELIAARAVGNPFFCEELVAALAESGHLVGERGAYRLGKTLEDIVLPATVQATLGARIDRLEAREKELLHLAAVIGYEVPTPLLQAVAGLEEAELGRALRSLVASELLTERMGPSGVEYAFKHPLTQEVAYRSQLGDQRRHVHGQVAVAIGRLFPDRLDELAALVAQHWEAAGELLTAANWNARAARWIGVNDMTQAVAHWQKVGELSQRMLDVPEGAALARLAHVRQLDYGWRLGMPEAEATEHYEKAREILERAGDRAGVAGLAGLYSIMRAVAGDVREADRLSDEVNRQTQAIGHPGLRMGTVVASIWVRVSRGRLNDVLELTDEALALGAREPTLGTRESIIVSPYAWCLFARSWTLSLLARYDEARESLDHALRVAREHEDVETEGWTHMGYVFLARYTGETELAITHGAQGYEIAERIGSAFSRAWQTYFYGCARLMAGEPHEAIALVRTANELGRAACTSREMESMRVATLAEALLERGDLAGASEAADEAVALAEERGNDAVLAYCYRVLAGTILASEAPGKFEAAQAALDRAIVAVQSSGARAELQFIEQLRERAGSLAAGTADF